MTFLGRRPEHKTPDSSPGKTARGNLWLTYVFLFQCGRISETLDSLVRIHWRPYPTPAWRFEPRVPTVFNNYPKAQTTLFDVIVISPQWLYYHYYYMVTRGSYYLFSTYLPRKIVKRSHPSCSNSQGSAGCHRREQSEVSLPQVLLCHIVREHWECFF